MIADNMQPLLTDEHGYVLFLIKIKPNTIINMDFEVVEVVSWEGDGSKLPGNTELYLEGCIKWDGCSHIWFGAKENGRRDGYIHMCGEDAWKNHAAVMLALFELAKKTIPGFKP